MYLIKKNIKFIILINVFLFHDALAGGGAPIYYSDRPFVSDRVTKKCDIYIKDKAEEVYSSLPKMEYFYNKKEWMNLDEILKNIDIEIFLDNTRRCSGVFKYKGGREYFYTAHRDLMLLHTIYTFAIEQKTISNAKVHNLTKSIVKDLKALEAGVREQKTDQVK